MQPTRLATTAIGFFWIRHSPVTNIWECFGFSAFCLELLWEPRNRLIFTSLLLSGNSLLAWHSPRMTSKRWHLCAVMFACCRVLSSTQPYIIFKEHSHWLPIAEAVSVWPSAHPKVTRHYRNVLEILANHKRFAGFTLHRLLEHREVWSRNGISSITVLLVIVAGLEVRRYAAVWYTGTFWSAWNHTATSFWPTAIPVCSARNLVSWLSGKSLQLLRPDAFPRRKMYQKCSAPDPAGGA